MLLQILAEWSVRPVTHQDLSAGAHHSLSWRYDAGNKPKVYKFGKIQCELLYGRLNSPSVTEEIVVPKSFQRFFSVTKMWCLFVKERWESDAKQDQGSLLEKFASGRSRNKSFVFSEIETFSACSQFCRGFPHGRESSRVCSKENFKKISARTSCRWMAIEPSTVLTWQSALAAVLLQIAVIWSKKKKSVGCQQSLVCLTRTMVVCKWKSPLDPFVSCLDWPAFPHKPHCMTLHLDLNQIRSLSPRSLVFSGNARQCKTSIADTMFIVCAKKQENESGRNTEITSLFARLSSLDLSPNCEPGWTRKKRLHGATDLLQTPKTHSFMYVSTTTYESFFEQDDQKQKEDNISCDLFPRQKTRL